MVLFSRSMTALPGKIFDLIGVTKEIQSVVKKLVGLDLAVYAVSGGVTGELVCALTLNNYAHYEEVVTALVGNPVYQAAFNKTEGLIAPGARDQLLRSI